MDYDITQLLPIVAWLTDKYTSKESSSVPYETAQMLMEAVIYCVEAGQEGTLIEQNRSYQVRTVYDIGYQKVIQKVLTAKEMYDQIIRGFEDYGCRNCRDTLINGMPAFFVRYDARFSPHKHLLTLDYPLLNGNPDKCGVNLILEYLEGILREQEFLRCFDNLAVVRVLEALQPDYRSLYLDNICYQILLTAAGCVIADRPVGELLLDKEDYQEIAEFFDGDSIDSISLKLKNIIGFIIRQSMDEEAAGYFKAAARSYAVRIKNGIEMGTLPAVIPT